MTQEVLKLALEALELVNMEFVCDGAHHAKKDRHKLGDDCPVTTRYQQAITAIKEALAQPEQETPKGWKSEIWKSVKQQEQEPVAWRNAALRVGEDLCSVGPFGYYDMTAEEWLDWALSVVTVHAPPPQRTWVGLTDEERKNIMIECESTGDWAWELKAAQAIEAKLKEKNT